MPDEDFESSVRERLGVLRALVQRQRTEGGDPLLGSLPPAEDDCRPLEPLALQVLDRMGATYGDENWSVAWPLAARLIRNTLRMRTTEESEFIQGTNVTREGLGRLLLFLEARSNSAVDGGDTWAKWTHDFLRRPTEADDETVDDVSVAQLKLLNDMVEDVPIDLPTDPVRQGLAGSTSPSERQHQVSQQDVGTRIDEMQKKISRLEDLLVTLNERLSVPPERTS